MSAREFEMYHGAVLTKLLRSEKPVALRLVETRPEENWSTYTLNDAVNLLVTHSKKPRAGAQGTSWTFVFSRNQLRQLDPDTGMFPAWAALVCGRKVPSEGDIHVCLLDPDQLRDLIDFSSAHDSVTIHKPSGKGELRVIKDRQIKFRVAQSRIDTWELPGS